MNEFVLTERVGNTAVITLNRPEKLNAWTSAMRISIIEHLESASRDTSIKAVVLTGNGRGFCAGQDLLETANIEPDDHAASDTWIDGFETLYRTIRNLDKPVVAALNGVAAGSGFQFALLADMRIGHSEVRMGQPEILSGIPSITGIWAMWAILGRARTTEFVLTGKLVDAVEAAQLGLLTEIVAEADVLPSALALAAELGSLPKGAFKLTKNRLRELEEDSFNAAFSAAKKVHSAAYESGEPQREMDRFLNRNLASDN